MQKRGQKSAVVDFQSKNLAGRGQKSANRRAQISLHGGAPAAHFRSNQQPRCMSKARRKYWQSLLVRSVHITQFIAIMENQTKAKPRQSSSSKSTYLLAYNGVSFILWSIVTLRAIVLIPALASHDKLYGLYEALFNLLRATQTIALLEVAHAALGLVRASPVTTAMQVASRIMLVWGILTPFPEIVMTSNAFGRHQAGTTGGPVALAGCHLAWGVTEMIRYGFFVWKEGVSDAIPGWLMWLRYNTFFVLYPIGISSECVLMYLALEPAQDMEIGYDWLLKAVLAIYVPGSYILYTHMMAQRRKTMKGKSKAT